MTPNPKYQSPTNPGMLLQDRTVDPLQPETFEPNITEIILALPNINRYNGHTIFPYSVAQHSLNCAGIGLLEYGLTEPYEQVYLLLHDACEAYLQDIVRPLKRFSSDAYLEAEKVITDKIMYSVLPAKFYNKLQSTGFKRYVEDIDTRMAVTEVRQLFPNQKDLIPGYRPYDLVIMERPAKMVRKDFAEAVSNKILETWRMVNE